MQFLQFGQDAWHPRGPFEGHNSDRYHLPLAHVRPGPVRAGTKRKILRLQLSFLNPFKL